MRRLPVAVDRKHGYVDEHGEIVIPLQYDIAMEFAEGVAPVFRPGEETVEIIDMDGRVQGRCPNVETYSTFSQGRLDFNVVDEMDSNGFLDVKGKVVIPPTFGEVSSFEDGLATARVKLKTGVIDLAGDWVIKPQFDDLWTFKTGEEITAFEQKGKWGLVNRGGEILIPPKYDYAMGTCEGITPVYEATEDASRYGFVNAKGEWTVPPTFQKCGTTFNEGTLPVEFDGQWGVVDVNGEWVIPAKYTCTNAFYDGLCNVYVGGRRDLNYDLLDGATGFINRDDELVIPAQFDSAFDFEDGVAQVEEFHTDYDADEGELMQPKTGWIDRTGKYIWKPTL
jgi:hypothetical protein